jgi:hypothetical protein
MPVSINGSPTIVTVTTGTPGPPGPQGPPGSGGAYFSQNFQTPALSFTVVHNLGIFPAVTFVDSFERPIVGDIQYIDSNSLSITFTAAESGTIYCS